MPCCGNKRAALRLEASRAAGDGTGASRQDTPATGDLRLHSSRPNSEPVLFQYIGKTALTVLGPITGRRYRFASHGVVIPVDQRDAPFVLGVPHLRRTGG